MTEKQLIANRNNAKLGGVKTDEGKAKIKLNAVRHGLLSKKVLMKSENWAELLELEKNLIDDFKPQNQFETLLVDRIISGMWRLKRALTIENNMMNKEMPFNVEFRSDDFMEAKNGRDMYDDKILDRLLRYEISLERGVHKALHELQRLIAGRSGENVMVPIAVDFNFGNKA